MIKYEHLLGRPFVHGQQDCYDLVRCMFRDNLDIELQDYARPDNWWAAGMNLYAENFAKEGFKVIDIAPHEAQPFDVFLIAVGTIVPSHAGVYIGNGEIVHHYIGRLSEKTQMKAVWRNCLCMIVRHKDVVLDQPVTKIDLMDLIHPMKKAKWEDARRAAALLQ